MGCRILSGSAGAGFYCSVSDVVFGPLMEDKSQAEDFMKWLDKDPREYKVDDLMGLFNKFLEEISDD